MTAAPRAITLASPAKINLFLEILRRRPDGYHTLSTVFQEITLADTLQARVSSGAGLSLTTDAPGLKTDNTNLILRAAQAFKDRFPRTPPLHFFLKKRIPIGAGLGGGSSNAATALQACWAMTPFPSPHEGEGRERGGLNAGTPRPNHPLPRSSARARRKGRVGAAPSPGEDEKRIFIGATGRDGGNDEFPEGEAGPLRRTWRSLFPLAQKLGADVPFFLRGGLAGAGGIGERLTSIFPERQRAHHFVLIFPKVFSSTPEAYRAIHFPLTKRRSRLKLTRALADGAPARIWARWLFNRLEETVLPRLKPVGVVKNALLQAGCLNALMSGSGSSVFGAVESAAHGRRVMEKLRREAWDQWLVSSVAGHGKFASSTTKARQHGNHGNQGVAPR